MEVLTMNNYNVRYLKNGECFEIIVKANTADEAREKSAIKFNIPLKFEIETPYMNEYNHVSSVLLI